MGITTEEFFQNVYNVMFSPKDFFENENIEVSIRLGAGIIAAMTLLNKTAEAVQDSSFDGAAFILTLFLSILSALFMWFLTALFFEYTAKIFNRGGQLAKFLYFSAYASVPIIFFAPLNLLKEFGSAGYFISAGLGCILYAWLVFLYAYAVKGAYKSTLARAFMFIFIPFISFIPAVYQLAGFYNEMRHIFSI